MVVGALREQKGPISFITGEKKAYIPIYVQGLHNVPNHYRSAQMLGSAG